VHADRAVGAARGGERGPQAGEVVDARDGDPEALGVLGQVDGQRLRGARDRGAGRAPIEA
jgi:hypothetical protein